MKVAVVGIGYVGLSNGVLLAQHNEVICLDIVPEKVAKLNNKKSLVEDAEIEDFLKNKTLNICATLNRQEAYAGADYVNIATPTDYEPETNYFNTESIEAVIRDVIIINTDAVLVIKSAVPVGYTQTSARSLFSCAGPAGQHHLFTGISARRQGGLRQPESLAHCGQRKVSPGRNLRQPAQAGGGQAGCSGAVCRQHRGRGDQALCQHLPPLAHRLLKRAGYLRRPAGSRYPADRRGGLP